MIRKEKRKVENYFTSSWVALAILSGLGSVIKINCYFIE